MAMPPDATADSGHAAAPGAPDDPRLREALALLQGGALAAAGQLLARLLDETPGNPDVHRALALLASRSGRQAQAVQHMQQASALAPRRSDLRFQLACLLAHAGQLQPALAQFDTLTTQQPEFVDGWRLQGTTQARLGRDGDARRSLQQARQLAPDDSRVLAALAELEFRSGWPADALPLWQRLLQLQPDDLHVRLRTGETLSRLGEQAQAVAVYRQGAQRHPDADALWLALGQAEEDNGQRDAARQAYEQALVLHPDWPFALACLVGLLRGNTPEPRLQQAEALLSGTALSDDDRALLGYALGKARDARGQYPQAMAAWDDANAARQRVAGAPDPAALRQRVDAIIAACPPALFAQRAPDAGDAPRLVFVVGMPRSGTTLTEQILASHPQAHGCGELPDLAMLARQLAGGTQDDVPGPRLQALRAPGALDEAIARYLAAATRHAPGDARVLVDKEPMNFLQLGLVALMFPAARIIWCRRAPRDIAISIYGENFALTEPLATDLAAIGHYIDQQARLMRHWQAVLPLPILESRYESLVADPEAQARRIVEFAGLDWDPACLEFHKRERAVQSPSRWQVRQPVHTRSVDRWRNYEAVFADLRDVFDAG